MVFIFVVTLSFFDKPDFYVVLPVPSFIVEQKQCDEAIPTMQRGFELIRVKNGAKSFKATCFGRKEEGE